MRRAQGIGINVVIIAAIALLVLVIIAVIVAQSGGHLSDGLNRCSVQGGVCAANPADAPRGYVPTSEYTCAQQFEECYVPT